MKVTDRFLRYVQFETTSNLECQDTPSSPGQRVFAAHLAKEMQEIGLSAVRLDQSGILYAALPQNIPGEWPTLGFITHMDTSAAVSGKEVKPHVVRAYPGGDIPLGKGILSVKDNPALLQYIGQDLIVTDGTTLLGADDKAGIAEVMTLAQLLLSHPEIPHGPLRFAVTVDEEIGRGVKQFDLEAFDADYAYTVDGGPLGELQYENFNAATVAVRLQGFSVHPGSAKGRMRNAIELAMELHAMLPTLEHPGCTDGYEGYYLLDEIEGSIEQATMIYLVRDHDRDRFEQKKKLFWSIASFLNQKYADQVVLLHMEDVYYNMKEQILPEFHLIRNAEFAMRKAGVRPVVTPVRGGTDGAQLSYRGLPCPNLGTGGHNFHSREEFIPIQSMEKTVEILRYLVQRYAQDDWRVSAPCS